MSRYLKACTRQQLCTHNSTNNMIGLSKPALLNRKDTRNSIIMIVVGVIYIISVIISFVALTLSHRMLPFFTPWKNHVPGSI